jgi:FkbM family methyltransferase
MRGNVVSLRSELAGFVLGHPRLRRVLTRVLAGDRDVEVDLFGTRLLINTVKENGYLRAARCLSRTRSLLWQDAAVLMNLALLMEDGDTFIDVGANVGLYTATLGRRLLMRPGRNRIYAFEPNPDTLQRLGRVAQRLGATVVPKGVSDRTEKIEFVGGAVSNIFAMEKHATAMNLSSERICIECCRLDEAGLEGERFLIKIDVEGHELEVLQGAEGLFAADKVFGVYVDGCSAPAAVEAFLRARGMAFFDGVTLERIPGGRFNLLALRQETG